MDELDLNPPYDPQDVPGDKTVVRCFCENPINGRVEWLEAKVERRFLGTGSAISEEVRQYILESNIRSGDEPCMVIAESLGGDGDAAFNAFPAGRKFDLATFKNETESMVYHYVKDSGASALVRVKFMYKNTSSLRPFKLVYKIELDSGDTIENELLNL